jgi:trehalose-6-phosphate synthase
VEMPKAERRRRMQNMRQVVRENNIYKWAADIISELAKFEFGE